MGVACIFWIAYYLAGKFAGEVSVIADLVLFSPKTPAAEAARAGFRFGDKGTHTSRTMMLAELAAVFAVTAPNASRGRYADAIVGENCLGKTTTATRRLTNQRLGELYGLDPTIPLFRVLRRVWDLDPSGGPLAALLCAVARDPLLAATASAVLPLSPGEEFQRDTMRTALRDTVGPRLNDAILDKVVRNAASSWTQSGHLDGRTFKRRRLVRAIPATLAYALYLAHAAGYRGSELLSSGWCRLLDCDAASAQTLALEAKRLGLIDLRIADDVVTIDPTRLDPVVAGA